MRRTLNKETTELIGSEVLLQGWVKTRRDHGKLIFLDLWDRTGLIQVVINPHVSEAAHKVANEIRPEFVIGIKGKVNKRPENSINKNLLTGTVEIEAIEVEIISKADTLPFDMGQKELNLELPTLLDHRCLTLRHPKIRDIFRVQAALVDGFRKAAEKIDCTEIVVPTIVASSTEGGTELFPIEYYEHKAFLSQSPQLYKQMMVPIFERVYTIAHAYRAEPSVTTYHLSETTQMDCEMGFVTFDQLLDFFENVGKEMLEHVQNQCKDVLNKYKMEKLAFGKTPRLTLREAQEIIFKEFKRDQRKEKDLTRQDEVDICKWAKENHQSDIVTITHFPTLAKPFYTMPDPKDPEHTLSYDLLFRGVEVMSGSQRINDYEQLYNNIKTRGMNPKNFEMYLSAFKYGMPQEGGFSFGLERITMKLLNLANIRKPRFSQETWKELMKDFLFKVKKQTPPFFIPIFFLVLLLSLYLVDNDLKKQINLQKTRTISFSISKPNFYPVLNSATESPKLNISAKAFIVMDNDSKVILESKNANLRFSMASTTKIMTAITALGFYKINDVLTIKTNNVEGTVLGLKKDDQFFFEDLLYAMLLPSANDAALAIAQNYPGGESEFIKQMNGNAKDFNLPNTHFADPAGLQDDGDYTTVLDLARLTSIALRNKEFAKIVSTKQKQITNIDKTKNYYLSNLNILLGKDGVNGVKTGFTQEAGGVLVTSKIEDGHDLIMVVMKSQDRFFDTQQLLSLIDGNLRFLNLDY